MNSLYQQLNNMSQPTSSAKKLLDMVRTAKDPNAMLIQLFEQNPQMKQVLDIIQKNGGDPKVAFYTLAKEKGINPEDILSILNR